MPTCMAFQWTLAGPALMRRWRSNEGQREPPAPRKDCCSHSSPSPSSSSSLASRDGPGWEPTALSVEAGAGGGAAAASDAGSKGDCKACSGGVSSGQVFHALSLHNVLPCG